MFTALAVAKFIEDKTELSIKRFVRMLEPIRSGVVSVGGQTIRAKADIPPEISALLKNLMHA